jgi:anti-sigma factor RsiW
LVRLTKQVDEMKCAKTKLVSPYVDDELSEKDRLLFDEHRVSCPECAGRVQAYQKARGLFLHAERYQAPYGFTTRVIARATAQEKKRLPWFFPLVTRLAEVAVVLVMISVGIFAGTFVMNGMMNQRMGNVASDFSLDLFEPAPPNSVGGAYLAMTEAGHEQ